MADFFTKIKGIIGTFFQIGGPTGPGLKKVLDDSNDPVIEARNSADSAYVGVRAARIKADTPGAFELEDVATLIDLKARIPNIHYAFKGDEIPAAGDHTGDFGICHTTAGSYTKGDVVYDAGAVIGILLIPRAVCKTLTTEVAVTGEINLIDNGVYAWDTGAAAWVLKGDGTAGDVGLVKGISVAFNHGSTVFTSTTALTAGCIILRAQVNITEAFGGGGSPSVEVKNGSKTLVETTDVSVANVGIYQVPQETDSQAAVITVNVAAGAATGEGVASVEYVDMLP